MKIYVGVTDNDWFRHLRARPDLDEINFWQPSGSTHFRALAAGEPFLFKLHSPENFIAGGGLFAHFSFLPHRTAWEWFGEANGVSGLEEMRHRLSRYRRQEIPPFADVTIGCVMLVNPFLWEERDWIPVPKEFSRNIVRGKGFLAHEGAGAELWEQVLHRLAAVRISENEADRPMFGEPVFVRRRLGQGTFRSLVTDLYSRRCAVTGERALPVLDAAHIKPVAAGGFHETSNGLLLRSDIHRLYDRGYVTVTPDHRFRVSSRLKTDFDNGEPYYPLQGQQISMPRDSADQPNREALEWHADTIFRP